MKRRAIPAISLALVVLFSASFLLALPGAVSMPASAVTQAEIDALKESAGELEQQQKEIQAQLNAIAADKDEALEQKSLSGPKRPTPSPRRTCWSGRST